MEFRGPVGVRRGVTDFLRTSLPPLATECRLQWGLTDDQLPLPVDDPDPRTGGYFDREPTALDRFPLIAVTSGRRTTKAIDHEPDGALVYRAMYPMRIYSWVRDGSHSLVADQRDNLGTLIMIAVSAHPGCGSEDFEADLKTLVLAPSDITPVKGDRLVAGSYVGFDLYATETLTDRLALPGVPARDTVSGVTATTGVLPHPALQ